MCDICGVRPGHLGPRRHRVLEGVDPGGQAQPGPWSALDDVGWRPPSVHGTDDALHCRGECIAKFFPGVPAALENLAAGVDVELDYETTREEAAVRDAGQSDGALLT